jgi:hypothetical protein
MSLQSERKGFQIEVQIPIFESDENFAYIVRYTSNGEPFGLTPEEFESIEKEDKN